MVSLGSVCCSHVAEISGLGLKSHLEATQSCLRLYNLMRKRLESAKTEVQRDNTCDYHR